MKQPPPKSERNYRPTWAEISAGAFETNLSAVRSLLGPTIKLLAVLKADAYGHGAVPLARVAEKKGADMIGVSSVEEGLELRSAGITSPILILGGVYPLENFQVAVEAGLTPTVASRESAEALADIAHRLGRVVSFHLKVDTGMGRIGVSAEAAKKMVTWIPEQKQLRLEGVYSHFACSDSDPEFTENQGQAFEDVRQEATRAGHSAALFHICNSWATLRMPRYHLNMVRPGLALYGAASVPEKSRVKFSPVLSWKSKIIFLKKVRAGTSISYARTFVTKRESLIATLPVGYADGVPRRASNKGVVLVNGRRCQVVGQVTMDQIMVDVTGGSAAVGDEVVLIGQQGGERVTPHEWAKWAGTIPYEILCGISKRVPRVMVS